MASWDILKAPCARLKPPVNVAATRLASIGLSDCLWVHRELPFKRPADGVVSRQSASTQGHFPPPSFTRRSSRNTKGVAVPNAQSRRCPRRRTGMSESTTAGTHTRPALVSAIEQTGRTRSARLKCHSPGARRPDRTSLGVETRHDEVSPIVSAVMILGGVAMIIAGRASCLREGRMSRGTARLGEP